MQCLSSQRKKLFAALILIESLILVCAIIAGNVSSLIFLILIKIVLILVAQYCNDPQWASLYAVFALISAIYALDPVGLFVTGHGDRRSSGQNIALAFIFLLSAVGSYLGYLYAKEIHSDQRASQNDNSYPGYRAYPPNPETSNHYGGTNYMYQQPSQPYTNNYNQSSGGTSTWKPFTGQGHSLG